MTLLHVSGPRGVGKSVVAWELLMQVTREGIKTGYLDLAQIGFHRPAQPDFTAHNIDAVCRTYRDAGARCLVISGSDSYLVPGATLCWLHASRNHLIERLLMRGRGEGPPIPGDELRGKPPAQLRRLARDIQAPGRADLVINR